MYDERSLYLTHRFYTGAESEMKVLWEMSPLYFGLEVFCLFESQNLTINPSHLDCTEPEFLNIYWRLKSQLFREDPSFQRSECTAGLIVATIFRC
jgi:hypothetical protein